MSIELKFIKSALSNVETLSMHDFEYENQNSGISEYLSLAITRYDGHFYIRITTTDAQPITYVAIIPNIESVDLDVVKFEIQPAL